MNILYYTWNENSFQDMKETLKMMSHNVEVFHAPMSDYSSDAVFEEKLIRMLAKRDYDMVFTFDYFPIISKVLNQVNIRYVSWIYDCPHYALYSKTVRNPVNYIFSFDRLQYQELKERGAVHAYHLPLAVNRDRIQRAFQIDWDQKRRYTYEVSFAGNLYQKNLYRQIVYLPDQIRGYLEGVMAAQEKIWGLDLISGTLTDDILEECLKYLKIPLEQEYEYTKELLIGNLLYSELTARERKKYLEAVAGCYDLELFTASKGIITGAHLKEHEYVSYTDELPGVFWKSKINLNITARSVTSGIPQRAMDIMGAGGFLLSNYQAELSEYFVPGEEFVYFEDEKDLKEKVRYYLNHDSEREQIAYNGWKKTEQFTYPGKAAELMQLMGVPDNERTIPG